MVTFGLFSLSPTSVVVTIELLLLQVLLSLSVYASWASCGLFSLFSLLASPFAHWVLPEPMWSPFVISACNLYKYLARTTRNARQSPHSPFPLSSASPSSLHQSPQSSQSSLSHLSHRSVVSVIAQSSLSHLPVISVISQSSLSCLAVVPLVVWDPRRHSFVVPPLVYVNPLS